MSEEEKKGGKYDKPESKEAGGDDLEDVSGGLQEGYCNAGATAQGKCISGHSVTPNTRDPFPW